MISKFNSDDIRFWNERIYFHNCRSPMQVNPKNTSNWYGRTIGNHHQLIIIVENSLTDKFDELNSCIDRIGKKQLPKTALDDLLADQQYQLLFVNYNSASAVDITRESKQ